MTKRFGFTLAEVLITLGIIGVVAAMTMPTLINQTNGAQYKAAYKKALSAIAQGITLNVALDDADFADTKTDGTAGGTILSVLQKRMNVVRALDGEAIDSTYNLSSLRASGGAENPTASNTTVFFNDGAMFTFPKDTSGCTSTNYTAANNKCRGYIDVNGLKGPNKEAKCDSADDATCTVGSPTDIYAVKFFGQTILPNSYPARAVLYGKS